MTAPVNTIHKALPFIRFIGDGRKRGTAEGHNIVFYSCAMSIQECLCLFSIHTPWVCIQEVLGSFWSSSARFIAG